MPDRKDTPVSASPARPPVSVIVPFAGDPAEARELLGALLELRLGAADELLVVDNSVGGTAGSLGPDDRVSVLRASAERSSYYARNIGAEAASGEWLLFTDSDCRPSQSLIDDFLAEPVEDAVGALAGSILPAPQPGLLADWAADRELINQEALLSETGPKGAATANLLVRRRAWASIGGFLEGVRSGADVEFCWRLGDAGWRIEYRPEARVLHLHRTRLGAVARQMARYGAGNAWQERRRPGTTPGFPLFRSLARCVGGAAGYALTLRPRRAAMKAIDAVAITASAAGRRRGNAADREPNRIAASSGGPSVVIATDYFPTLSETFVAADVDSLLAAGWRVRVEAVARPDRPRAGGARGISVNYLEDEGTLDRLRALAWLTVRHPVGCIRDLRLRNDYAADERMPLRAIAPAARRLREGGEERVHAHFALMAAVNAERAGAIVRRPVSIAAHAHEIFARPRRLREKLERASFTVADCEYTVEHLRGLVSATDQARIHEIVLGVDLERWRRRGPHPGGRTVVAVGRLVEKKGFVHLIEAVASLARRGAPPDRAVIVGDGPLREQLRSLAAALGVEELVELAGSMEPGAVRELLESADLLCMPCVIASDGDRDSMPVVVKEALAMEIPVIASDEVGLPEIVEPGWGRLVPPGDAKALADAIEELLALPAAERAEMGRRGRAAVEARANLAVESAKLARLLRGAVGG